MQYKVVYKRIKSVERKTKGNLFNQSKLINMLINIKSWSFEQCKYDNYSDELKRLLKEIRKGRKSWHGDVKNYAFKKYARLIKRPKRIAPHLGSTQEIEYIDGIPF